MVHAMSNTDEQDPPMEPYAPAEDIGPPLRHMDDFTHFWNPADYAGQRWVSISATQLDEVRTQTQKRKILEGWIDLLGSGSTPITHLYLCSRVPQHLLDAVAGVHNLEFLDLKWGPYEDLSPVADLPCLEALHLGGASRVTSLAPLKALPRLIELDLSNPFRLSDVAQLGELSRLRYLTLGTEIGTDRSLHLPDLDWVRSLQNLISLLLIGTIVDSGDYSPLLDLPGLRRLGLPLKRQHLGQILDLAEQSEAFADVAAYWEMLMER